MSAEFNDVGRKIDDALLTGLRAHFEGSSRTERPALSSETMRVRSFGFDQIPRVLKLWPISPSRRWPRSSQRASLTSRMWLSSRVLRKMGLGLERRSEEHTSELQSRGHFVC